MFKVGDLVRVRKELCGHNTYDNVYFNRDMEIYRGLIFRVKYVDYDDKTVYILRTVRGQKYPSGTRDEIGWWCWSEAMLENLYVTELIEFLRKERGC